MASRAAYMSACFIGFKDFRVFGFGETQQPKFYPWFSFFFSRFISYMHKGILKKLCHMDDLFCLDKTHIFRFFILGRKIQVVKGNHFALEINIYLDIYFGVHNLAMTLCEYICVCDFIIQWVVIIIILSSICKNM